MREFIRQLEERGIRDRRVLRAMSAVPREEFVPSTLREHAYRDGPLAIGEGQTISQPYIVALMTEALSLKGGERVLEIGTGSGYQTAVLAEMGCEVYSLERIGHLGAHAAEVLGRLGYHGINLRVTDGGVGWPEEAPFDALILTCAAAEFPTGLFAQLAEGGRMVAPIGPESGIQVLWLYRRGTGGRPDGTRLCDVRFVPLVASQSDQQ